MRREAIKETLVQLLAEARQRSVDVIACAGGLFHRECAQPSNLRWLMTAFESVALPILIAPGDEDWLGPRSGYTQYAWPGNVTIFDGDRLSPIDLAEGLTIWGAAHRSADGQRPFLDRFQVDRAGVNLALFHASERSGMTREPIMRQCATFDEGEMEATGLDHVMVGHFQRAHFGDWHTYPGAPIRHEFSWDDPSEGVSVIEIKSNGEIEREFIEIASPPLRDVLVDVSDIGAQADLLSAAKRAISKLDGVVRLRLSGRLGYDTAMRPEQLSRLGSKSLQVIVDTKDVAIEIDIDELGKESSVRGQYVRDVESSTRVSDPQRARALSIGLRALDGHEDLEVLP